MAEKSEKKPEAAPADPAAPAKKGLPVKAIGAVGVIMLIEGAAVFMVAKGTSPQAASAEVQVEGKDQTDHEASVEIALVDDRFQNIQTGRVWVWDAEIVLKVKSKNQAFVEETLASRSSEIKEGVSMIFRRAQHNQLKEPGLETINRQLSAYLNQVFGKDAESKERLERIIIPKCKGFPAD